MNGRSQPEDRHKKLDSMISLRLTPYEMEVLRAAAAARNTSLSATLREAVASSVREPQVGYSQGTYTFNSAATTTQFVDSGEGRIALPSSPAQYLASPVTTHS